MSLQVLIGSDITELRHLENIRKLIAFVHHDDQLPLEVSEQELEDLDEWICGIHMLLTDVDVFISDRDGDFTQQLPIVTSD